MNESKRLAQLRRAVVEQLHTPNIDDLLLRLDTYIAAQLNGEDYAAQFEDVALMLDQSSELSSIYARMYDAAMAETEAAEVAVPTPDLSFLTPKTSVAQLLREAITTSGNKVRVALSDALLPLLTPPQTPAFALRGVADRERYTKEILRLEQNDDRPFGVTAWVDSQDETHCLVEVTVEPPGKMWPDLAGSIVAIDVNGSTATETTDEWGLAAFEGIVTADLASLVVEIDLS